MQLIQFEHSQELAVALAETIAKTLTSLLEKQNQVTFAVSGGKSPISIFQHLTNMQLPWHKVTLTLVDERFIPPDKNDSNELLVKTHLLQNHLKSALFIGLYHNNSSIKEAVAKANENINHIDIALLGMGEDGHTASIFPCCNEIEEALSLDPRAPKYIATTPKTAKYSRIGLSLKGIQEIPYLFLNINGLHKLNVFSKANEILIKACPISYVLNLRPDLKAFWCKEV